MAFLLAPYAAAGSQEGEPERLDRGRFTVVAYSQDVPLARSLLERAVATDTFPGLPRPRSRVLIVIAPSDRRFRELVGREAPEWGAAVAFPNERRIVMQGRSAGSDAGDPRTVLRHELAHLALHEALDDLPPRWFDEGYASYAAGEWGREEVLATSLALLAGGVPQLDSLDSEFSWGAVRANAAYALAFRAVAELAALDPERGLALFFRYWRETGSLDRAMRRAYGITEDEFDRLFRDRTMRRYGALAIAANVYLGASLILVLVVPLYYARRRRQRRRLTALVAAEERAERAAQASAIEELLSSVPPPPSPPPPAVP